MGNIFAHKMLKCCAPHLQGKRKRKIIIGKYSNAKHAICPGFYYQKQLPLCMDRVFFVAFFGALAKK
jgi:hypothetical protein